MVRRSRPGAPSFRNLATGSGTAAAPDPRGRTGSAPPAYARICPCGGSRDRWPGGMAGRGRTRRIAADMLSPPVRVMGCASGVNAARADDARASPSFEKQR